MHDPRSLLTTCLRFAFKQAGPTTVVDRAALESAAGLGLAEALQRYRPGRAAMSSYAYIRVRGAVTNALRNATRHRERVVQPPEGHFEPSWCPDHEDALTLRKVLTALPKAMRVAVWLRHGAGFTVAEIARRQGRSRASVHRDLQRGMELLRRSFGLESTA